MDDWFEEGDDELLQTHLDSYGGYEGTFQEYIAAWLDGDGQDDELLQAYVDRWGVSVVQDVEYELRFFQFHLGDYRDTLGAPADFWSRVGTWVVWQRDDDFRSRIEAWLSDEVEEGDPFRAYVASYDKSSGERFEEYVDAWLVGEGQSDHGLQAYVEEWSSAAYYFDFTSFETYLNKYIENDVSAYLFQEHVSDSAGL